MAMGKSFKGRWMSFGLSSGADLRGLKVSDFGARGMTLTLQWQGRRKAVRLRQGGYPSLRRALAAAAAALALGLSLDEVAHGLAAYRESLPGRLELIRRHGRSFIVDAYNASPQSMAAALDYLAKSAPAGKRFAALGEMRELGPLSRRSHEHLGRLARRAGVEALLAMGKGARPAAEAFGSKSLALGLHEAALGAAWLGAMAPRGSWILLKGSRASRVERLLETWPLGL
jgi:UDP-N-acetylmuramoyl-tripeptide--D-alanyl-D-alanine ligase